MHGLPKNAWTDFTTELFTSQQKKVPTSMCPVMSDF